MCDISCVLKRVRNRNGEVEWEALYINGEKEIEDYALDLDSVVKIFTKNKTPLVIEMVDTDSMANIELTFPDSEDFTYLLDYKELVQCDTVWIETGEHIVKEIWESVRPSGYYIFYDIIDDEIVETETYYFEHMVTYFKVIGSDQEYVWEDYNYRQSSLSTKLV